MVATLEAFLEKNLEADCYRSLTTKDKRQVKENLLMSLFHLQSDHDWRDNIKTTFGGIAETARSIAQLRSKLMTDPDINQYYKLKLMKRISGYEAEYVGLNKECFDEAHDCLLFSQRIKIKRRINRLPIKDFSPSHQQKLLQDITKVTDGFLGRFAYVKLRFITDSNRSKIQDIVHDLQLKVLETARWKYPFVTEAHLMNLCKQSARNAGINLIQYWTSKKRSRLSQDEHGTNTNTVVELTDDVAGYDPIAEIDGINTYSQMERHFEKNELLAFRLLTLNEGCLPFLRWACKELDEDYDSIEDMAKKLGIQSYQSLVSKYLQKPEEYISKFRKNLRNVYLETHA